VYRSRVQYVLLMLIDFWHLAHPFIYKTYLPAFRGCVLGRECVKPSTVVVAVLEKRTDSSPNGALYPGSLLSSR